MLDCLFLLTTGISRMVSGDHTHIYDQYLINVIKGCFMCDIDRAL